MPPNDNPNPVLDENLRALLGKAYTPQSPPPALAARVERLMRREAAKRAIEVTGPWLPAMAGVAAAVVLGVAAYLVLWHPSRTGGNLASGVDRHPPTSLDKSSTFNDAGSGARSLVPQYLLSATSGPANAGRKLTVGTTVQTEAGQRQRLALPDRSVLYVNQSTTLTLVADRLVNLVQGEVFVEAALEPGTSFFVQTPPRFIRATDAKFKVAVAGGRMVVVTAQGVVAVGRTREDVEMANNVLSVRTGQRLTVSGQTESPEPSGPLDRELEWAKGLTGQ